ncbi:MAG: hypothetical protein Edafosvirus5_8 [Edafosvirus sp.]|uniref:Uncharacterized protein n=1 Tax=Edafosvirus sp. TaxID=2487765 RepID=A0A3G4ZT63_9VIRU|nr:MAG: hypothetical protein Edafosvirus5_8 [Edafosvirus sp.]
MGSNSSTIKIYKQQDNVRLKRYYDNYNREWRWERGFALQPSKYNFKYDQCENFNCQFIVFTNVKLSENITVDNKIIPQCFVYKAMILCPYSGDLVILNDDNEKLYLLHAGNYRKGADIINFDENPHYDSNYFQKVLDYVIDANKYKPGGIMEKNIKDEFTKKVNDPKYNVKN